MKFFLLKDEKLKMEVTDPTSFSNAYKDGMECRVFQMETTVSISNLQPSDDRDDPEQKQLYADLMKKLRHPSSADAATKENDNAADESAKKRRVERNPTLKITLGTSNVSNKDDDDDDDAIIEINGEIITALLQMCHSLPKAYVNVKLTLVTDLFDPICKKHNFSVTTDEMRILDKTDGYTEYCCFYINLPDLVKQSLMNPKDGKKLIKIGGKFTIEFSLHNFEVSLVSPKTLNQTLLDEAESADVVICSGDGKEIPCHRAFLAVSSVVLKAMLRGSFQESAGKIEMPDMSEEGVKAFLAFLYYRDLTPAKETNSIAWELLNAGEKYNVIPLRTSIEKILLEIDEDSWWTVEAALQIFTFMNEIDSDLKEDVKKKIIQVMKRNNVEWMSSEVYQKMVKENPVLHTELLKCSFSLCSCELSSDSDSDSD